jgi:hypothetical protein
MAIPAVFPGFDPLGCGESCPRAGSGLGVTLAVLVMVVPFWVTVITDGTRLGAWVGEGLEVMEDVARVVGVGVGVGVISIGVEVFSIVGEGS